MTETNLSKIHMFPSEDSYNSNKGSVGSNDLALVPNTVYSHPNSGVTAGTYHSVTVNAQGHVTGGSNPTNADGTATPRYNAGVSCTINTTGYTAPSKGIVCGGTANGRDLGTKYFQVNGANVYNMQNYGTEGIPLYIPVNKGDVIKTTGGSFTCIFYPY